MADIILNEALDAIKLALEIAYKNGLHEFGYDPLEVVRNALTQPEPTAQQAAGDAEAVAWMYRPSLADAAKGAVPIVRLYRDPHSLYPGWKEQALYATPQPTETQRIVAEPQTTDEAFQSAYAKRKERLDRTATAAIQALSTPQPTEKQKIVAWLEKEADECRRFVNEETYSLEMGQLAVQRGVYYRQAAGMIRRGEHLKEN